MMSQALLFYPDEDGSDSEERDEWSWTDAKQDSTDISEEENYNHDGGEDGRRMSCVSILLRINRLFIATRCVSKILWVMKVMIMMNKFLMNCKVTWI